MSERARLTVISVIGGLLVVGGGYYFIKIYRPKKVLEAAQAEIADWDARFSAARDCLLGKTPKSSKTSEALAIREMSPDPWDRKSCTPMISKLSRGDAPESGIPEVERAWSALEKSAAKAALAYARHVGESTTLKEDPLPAALDELDAARQTLRTAARMASSQQTGAPLSTATLLPLVDGKDPLTDLVIDAVPSAHGMVLFGRTSSRSVQLVLSPGREPIVRRVAPGMFRGVPDASWGATATPDDVRIGALDTEGVLQTPTTFAHPTATIAAAVGSMDAGYAVFGDSNKVWIATAAQKTITAGEPQPIVEAQVAVDADGRAALFTRGANTTTRVQLVTPGAPLPAASEIPQWPSGGMCLSASRVWFQTFDSAVAVGGGLPTYTTPLGASLQGCTAEGAMFHDRARPDQIEICTTECRSVALPTGAPQSSTTTAIGGKLVAIASHGGVLGVWRESADPVFYALPAKATPVLAQEWPAMALSDGKVIDVIARGDSSFTLIRIPAH